jgi:hypothetical protein
MACQFVNLALPGGPLLDLGHPDGLSAVVVEGHPPVEGEREHVVAFGFEAGEQVRDPASCSAVRRAPGRVQGPRR